jgi:hypothetical protein
MTVSISDPEYNSTEHKHEELLCRESFLIVVFFVS